MNSPIVHKKVIYKDLIIRITGSLLISYIIDSLGRPESIFQRLTYTPFYIDLFSGFFIAMFIWEIIRRVVIYLDGLYDWFGLVCE